MDTLIYIDDTEKHNASASAKTFTDKNTRRRAYLNSLGAELAIKYLKSENIDVSNLQNIHSIKKILEETDISDIILSNIHIDIRVVLDENVIFIPKSHFTYNLIPDVYVVFELAKDSSHVKFLGFFEPQMINKNNQNNEYYFIEKEKLNPASDFIKYIQTHNFKTDETISDEKLEFYETSIVSMTDNDISENDKKNLIEQLTKCSKLRERFIEFENFETLSARAMYDNSVEKPELPQDTEVKDEFDEFGEFSEEDYEIHEDNSTDNEIDDISDDGIIETLAGAGIASAEAVAASAIDNTFETVNEGIDLIDNTENLFNTEDIDIPKEIMQENLPESDNLSESIISEENDIETVEDNSFEPVQTDENVESSISENIEENIVEPLANVSEDIITEPLTDVSEELSEDVIAEPLTNVTEELSEDVINENIIEPIENITEENIISENIADTEENINITLTDTIDLEEPVIETIDSSDNIPESLEDVSEYSPEENITEPLTNISEESPEDTINENIVESVENITEDIPLENIENISDISVDTNNIENIFNTETNENIAEPLTGISENLTENNISEPLTDISEELSEEIITEPLTNIVDETTNDNLSEPITDYDSKNLEFSNSDNIEINNDNISQVTEDNNNTFDDIEFSEPLESLDTEYENNLPQDNSNTVSFEELAKRNEMKNSSDLQPTDYESLTSNIFEESDQNDNSILDEQIENSITNGQNENESFGKNLIENLNAEEMDNVLIENESVNNFSDEISSIFENNNKESNSEEIAKDLSSTDNNDIPEEITSEQSEVVNEEPLPDDLLIADIIKNVNLDNNDESRLNVLYNEESSDTSQISNLEDDIEVEQPIPGQAVIQNNQSKKNLVVAAALITILVGFGIFTFTKQKNPSVTAENEITNTSYTDQNMPAENILADNVPNIPTAPKTDVKELKSSNQPAQQTPKKSTAYMSVSKLVWDVPDDLSYSSKMQNYLRTAGKSIKLSLSTDLLLANEYAYTNQLKIGLTLSKNGSIKNSKIVSSSGSTQIDKIVLQSVKDTLNVLKPPSDVINTPDFNLNLIIYF